MTIAPTERDCGAVLLATALMRTANSALPICGNDICAWLWLASCSGSPAAGVVREQKQIPPAPLFQRGELQRQERMGWFVGLAREAVRDLQAREASCCPLHERGRHPRSGCGGFAFDLDLASDAA